jgi:hypothetical protein
MAMAMLVLAGLALAGPWTTRLLLRSFYDPDLLAFVHLNTLGMIAALLLGASYQLVPVVLQAPLASVRLGRLSFWCFLGGVAGLVIGLARTWLPALATGGTLLAVAFALYVGIVAATLRRAPRHDVVAWHIATGLVSLTAGTSLGVTLALNKSLGFLAGRTLDLLAAHAVLMLGGWVAVMLAGVAYRLVGMFTLAEDRLWQKVAWIELVLTAGGAWLLAAGFLLNAPRTIGAVGSIALCAGLALFLAQLVQLYQHRRRRGFDVHIPFALTSAVCGVLASGLVAGGLIAGEPVASPIWVAAGWLATAGLAETAIQGFFYKIATFLVWLKRYAPVAGRQRVPKLEELYGKRLAVAGWALWTLGLVGAAVAAWSGIETVAISAGWLISAGLGCFLLNVARIAGHWTTRGSVVLSAHRRATSATTRV